MSRKKSKIPIDYKTRMKTVRRFVGFNYDLRKKLSQGQKSAITRAFKDVNDYKAGNFIPIKKTRGESRNKFRKRKSILKDASGQKGSMLVGVYTSLPKSAKTKVKGTSIIFEMPKFTDEIINANQKLLAKSPVKEAQRLLNEYEFSTITINYSGHMSDRAYEREPETYREFVMRLGYLGNIYAEVLKYAISGYIIRNYRKDSKKKRNKIWDVKAFNKSEKIILRKRIREFNIRKKAKKTRKKK